MKMTNEDWKYKIVNASPTRLVIVTYEIILDRISAAEEALEKGDAEKFRSSINNAKEFVTEMAASVDISGPVAVKLTDLYFFVNRLLTKAYFSNDTKFLFEAKVIIENLKNGLLKEVNDGGTESEVPEISSNYSQGSAARTDV